MPDSPPASPPLDAAARRARLQAIMFPGRVLCLAASGIVLAGSVLAGQAPPAAGNPAEVIAAAEAAGARRLFDYDFEEASSTTPG